MDAIREMYARWAAGDMGEDDQWGDVTAEPRGLDYAEVSADGVQAMWLVPHGAGPDAVIVALHGGGFVGGSRYTHRKMYGHLAKAAGVRVLLATYRLAPQFRYPAQIEDAVTAYRWAAARTRTVALAGDSSGGGLAVQVALRQPGAAALLLLSPWIDMDPAQTATSYEENAATDLFFTRPMVQGLIQQYLPEGISALAPEVNAFHTDLSALPPVYVQCGGDESGRGDSEVTARESVRLAFVAGLQHLAPRQRAVLLLREVLAFSAAETGEALGMSVPAVKSALQRARARLDETAPARDDALDATSPRARELLAGYMAAWEASDADAFREVLRADAAIEPVGSRTSYAGREACLAFATPSMGTAGAWRMVATEANGQPAAVAWFRGEPYGVAVLTVAEDGIVAITLFGDPTLAETFTPKA